MAKKKTRADQVVPVTTEEQLKRVLNADRRIGNKTRELADELREVVSNAVEHKHLHRAAFNIVKRLHRMDDEKLAEAMHHFEHYLEAAGINKRVEAVMRLPLEDDEKISDNVVAMQQQAAAE